jgi:hypothetical protein
MLLLTACKDRRVGWGRSWAGSRRGIPKAATGATDISRQKRSK